MLKDAKYNRKRTRNKFHKQDRAVVRDTIAKHGFDSLPMLESMRTHFKRVFTDCGESTQRYSRGFSMDAIDRCVDKFIGKPYNDLCSYVGTRLHGKDRNDALRHIEHKLGVSCARYPRYCVDFYVDGLGVCCVTEKKKTVKQSFFVVPQTMSTCFVYVNEVWWKCKLKPTEHFKLSYYADVMHKYLDREEFRCYGSRYSKDAFGKDVAVYNVSWLAGWRGVQTHAYYRDMWPATRHKVSHSDMEIIEKYISKNTQFELGFLEI